MLTLDTNVLVYAADKTAGNRHESAKQIVDRAAAARAAVTEQTLFEFFHASTRKKKLAVADATSLVQNFAGDFTVLFPHLSVVDDACALMGRYLLNIWDARMLAICAAHGCEYLLSEDLQDRAQYGGVTVINPFDAANAPLVGKLLT